ncbi:uncharacterized protein F4822DRAFT_442625 [Hypoxylon trugodes]|uniref:uncharacterized protein n=1 Tax=Hypoxylon trugodes TaxID=326681 RepID=UPI00219F7DF1|nr:uncharacterized protein F4822DRAFT_442625 [Hypoxylon trugodes]KAI1389255.1 hypothetical protein F4822DRAFT_442625 [Hypoxylon trugodes]
MFSHSSRTVRVSGIPLDIEEEDLADYWRPRSKGSSSKLLRLVRRLVSLQHQAVCNLDLPIVSLAPQNQYQTGTITFPSKALKRHALRKPGKWKLDDEFNWMTVLYAAAEPDIDICAIHGLNGNAFDTWAAENGHMWLRDFLPQHTRFKNSRIMTFGYSSLLRDSRNGAALAEWAHSLLQSIVSLRKSHPECTRPMIFVCHSLGGLVVREAMIQLHDFPNRYHGLSVKQCGLIFLSTPHSGAIAADWNEYLVELAERVGKVRGHDFAYMLGSFNRESRRAKERFKLINPTPPYLCLAETRETNIRGYARMIVTLDSAGLNGEPAQGVDGADHRTICQYSRDTDAGYIQIVECLENISERLRNDELSTIVLSRNLLSPNTRGRSNISGTQTYNGRGGRIYGGNAQGGDARGGDAWGSGAQGGNAQGGNAFGGNSNGSYIRGGNARGGDAGSFQVW